MILHAAAWAAMLAVTLAAVLMAMRGATVFSASEPRAVVTSGWEQESLMALWAFLHDLPLYPPVTAIPFRMSVYNWLFYVVYGGWTQTALTLTGLPEDWLPTFARLLTLAAVPVAIGAMWVALRRPGPQGHRLPAALAAAAAGYVAIGPLVGFWAMTVRPDLWAMALELSAIAAFLALAPRHRWPALAVVVLSCYAAWACKQTAINAAGAIFLVLALRRRWREAAALAAGLGGAMALTLALGSEAYLRSLLLLDYKRSLDLARAGQVLVNAAAKTVPVMAGLAAVAAMLAGRPSARRALMADDAALLGVAGAVTSLALALVTSTHGGAAENYYFTAAGLGMLAALAPLRLAGPWHRTLGATLAAAWLGQATLLGYGLSGGAVTSLDADHRHLTAAKRCLAPLARPLFVSDLTLSLPWMTPGGGGFVYSYSYLPGRAAGLAFEAGGLGGLIEAGHFATLALVGFEDGGRFDGAGLLRYEKMPQVCGTIAIYTRKEPEAALPPSSR